MIRRSVFLIILLSIIGILTVVMVRCTKEEYYRNDGINPPARNSEADHDVDTLAFTADEIDFIMSGDTSELMRVFLLYNLDESGDTVSMYEDSLVLRAISRNVTPDSTDEVLQHLVYRMYKSVNDPEHPGVGIAAPQVGVNRNVIWVQRQDKPYSPFEVYFNPEIIQFGSQWLFGMEGCLSVPDRSGYVRRARAILIKYNDWAGNEHVEMVEAYTARIFQHEIDHLNGIIYIDHLD